MDTTNTGGPSCPGPYYPSQHPGAADDGDVEWAEYVAWLDREAAAGRDPEPGPWACGDAEPWDPEPEKTDVTGPRFAADGDADALPPGPELAALTEQAVRDVARLSDDELVGVLRATQRQMAGEQYKQMLAAAEFGRRRQAAFDDALRRGVPAGCAPGGFPGEELSIELRVSRADAAHLIDDAIDLTSRLPQAGTRLDRRAIRTRGRPLGAAFRPHSRHHPDQIRHLDRGAEKRAGVGSRRAGSVVP